MKILNKCIAIVVSLCLLFNVSAASNLGDILLKNETYAGTWEDPSTGINYMSGGGIKIKFKQSQNSHVPWVKIGTPGYSVGCNGISIEGGFLALLGLDDIEKQLKDAGAAFAWGILIGLAYSLPAISTVFQQIQKWARQIQALLQNACNIGQNLALAGTGGKQVTDFFQGTAIEEGFGAAKDFMGDIDAAFDKIEEFANCPTPECTTEKGQAFTGFIKEAFGFKIGSTENNALGTTSGAAKKVDTSVAGGDLFYKKVPLSEILRTDSAYVTLTEDEILIAKLGLLFFGDIVLSQGTEQSIGQFFNDDGSINSDAFEAKAKKAISQGTLMDNASYELIAPMFENTSDAVDVLLNGTESTLTVPNYNVSILIVPNEDDSSQYTTSLFLLKEVSAATSNNLNFEWGGFFNEGSKQVMDLLKEGLSDNIKTLFNLPSASTIQTDKNYIPVLVPELKRYINDLRTAVTINPQLAMSSKQAALKIAQINAALATEALANEIYSRVKTASTSSTEQKELFTTFLADVEKKRELILSEIAKIYKDDTDIYKKIEQDVKDITNTAKEKTLN
jgi:hypothetical protein